MMTVSSSDLGERYDELTDTAEPVVVTKDGREHSVLLGIDEYRRMLEEILTLRLDPSLEEARAGKGIPWYESVEQLRNEFDL